MHRRIAMVKPILVTAAAGGRQRKTGRHVPEMLLARGVPVRAFVRQIDERSDQLRARGAEIFAGDFLDIRSVQRAAQGVAAVYFAYRCRRGCSTPPRRWPLRHAKRGSRGLSIS
jgi:nucleoside-diphosphate-sugar epimerase